MCKQTKPIPCKPTFQNILNEWQLEQTNIGKLKTQQALISPGIYAVEPESRQVSPSLESFDKELEQAQTARHQNSDLHTIAGLPGMNL